MSCANNNRFAVVVCFRLAIHSSEMRIFLEIFELKIKKNFVSLWWRNNSMMSQHIWDLYWLPFFYHKDPYCTKFSRFYLLWSVRYQHLCDFLHFQKCDNYVITSSNVWKNFQASNLSEPGQKYPHMPKISPGGLPVSSINSEYINIYIYSLLRLIGTRLFQSTCPN